MAIHALAAGLAHAFLAAGPWTTIALVGRAQRALGSRPVWLGKVAHAIASHYPRAPRDAPHELELHIRSLEAFRRAEQDREALVRVYPVFEPEMGRRRWDVPVLATTGALASFLGLGSSELAWLADIGSLERGVRDERLRNYRYVWMKKPSGGMRLLEAPKRRLRDVQRTVLHAILDPVPPHEAAHGFRKDRSVLTFARPHARQAVVVRMDLEDFFASMTAGRVFGLYREAGYPDAVAHTLTALCTNRLPPAVLAAAPRSASRDEARASYRLRRYLAGPHLPQGAPTSPALANLCAFRLDVRLSALAASAGLAYTRYADDLVFSGDAGPLRSGRASLARVIRIIIEDEGFSLNHRKTRIMPSSAQQRIGGLVINASPQAARQEYDQVKAIVHNAVRHGLEAENRQGHPDFRAHLRGRIAWIAQTNAARGERLLAEFERIPADRCPSSPS